MKQFLGLVLCATVCLSSFAAEREFGYSVMYSGGSLTGIRPGQGPKLFVEGDHIRIAAGKADAVVIPAASITEVSYGQDVHRRVGTAVAVGVFTLGLGALTALSKSKKHYVGLTWANGDQKGGLAVQCDKSDYRGILAALEGISGKKAVDSEAMTVKN
jgi:hypothetical protein